MEAYNIFWFRRDLRLYDNHGLSEASNKDLKVIPVFIFDTNITDNLPNDDRRINFIYENISRLNTELYKKYNSSMNVFMGNPIEIFKEIIAKHKIINVFTNHDYEPYAIKRDLELAKILKHNNINFLSFKDQVIFEKNEVVKDNGEPYVVYTPYMRKWKSKLTENLSELNDKKISNNFSKNSISKLLDMSDYGFKKNHNKIEAFILNKDIVNFYSERRNYPALNSTSKIGPFLRFGIVSIRKIVTGIIDFKDDTFLKELIWREFFMQILYHFPKTASQSFKSKYDNIVWLNNKNDFEAWKDGRTGFPLIDAGMRELNATGFMHNRVRMLTASFLCKQLLTDWRLGERYFALKLNDYEMASNIGNWQWASGSGVDAAPYFRIFNPHTQIERFDKDRKYIRKWVKYEENYPNEIVDHKLARQRCLETYKKYV